MLSTSAVKGDESRVQFPEELPITQRVRDLARAIQENQVVIVAGETGSGKTTQLPKICLAMGRGLKGRIGVTQPRRIAATSVAARVASELQVNLGEEVGYQIRFTQRTSRTTYVKFMTDGVLLAEIAGDRLLRAYDTIIVDEAHERSLNIDFLLGYLKRILPERPDLRVIVSSATLEIERFAAFFGGAPVVSVSGRTYPVEVSYRPPTADESDLAETVANTVEEVIAAKGALPIIPSHEAGQHVARFDSRGDILVFLPGEREIRETANALADHALPHTVVLPLYGRLSQSEQARVFVPLSQRRVILATNVAETSLTIPGIAVVIDAGTARINRYDARSGVTQLHIEPISRASADQRRGRAGRTRPGVAIRLYEQSDYEARAPHTDPELLRVGLAGVILNMTALELGDVREFAFLDPPLKRSIDEGYRVLGELGALTKDGELTDIGRKLARLPVDPRIGRMVLGGEAEGALAEVLVIAAALGVADPRERPLGKERQADQAHRAFSDEKSDFLGLIKLWRFYRDATRDKSQAAARRLAKDHFLSYMRMREWIDIHDQLASILRELGLTPNSTRASDDAVHRALLPGLLTRVGMYHPDTRSYIGARQTRFVVHPSSALSKKPQPWIVAAELVETSQLFARTVAAIDPEWLEAIAGPLCKRSYGEPHFVERAAEVMAKEHVTLYGLPIVRERRVRFAPIDPVGARRTFLVEGLARGAYLPKQPAPYAAHNAAILEEVRQLRARARQGDPLTDEDALVEFFEARIPDNVVSGKTFEAFRAETEAAEPRRLYLTVDDLLRGEGASISLERFPEALAFRDTPLRISYKFEPSEDDDGATITLPVALLPQLEPGLFDWTIPGWHKEKVGQAIYGLAKSTQRLLASALGPGGRDGRGDSLTDLVELVAETLAPRAFTEPFFGALSRALFEATGVRVPASSFRVEELPPYLGWTFHVVQGTETLGRGRDLADLLNRFEGKGRAAFEARARHPLEQANLTRMPATPLPEHTVLRVDDIPIRAYFAVSESQAGGVAVELVASPELARARTLAGLRRLFLSSMSTTLASLEKQVSSRVASSSLPGGGGALKKQLAQRAVDEAFGLVESLPRSKAAFDDRFTAGRARLDAVLAELGRLAGDVVVEHEAVRAMLSAMTGKPGVHRGAIEDIRSQLDWLVPPDFAARMPRLRMRALPVYLRGIRVRLERLPNGPQKDQQKAETVRPFWRDFLLERERMLDKGISAEELESFHWLVEELRLAVFAPEIGPTIPCSPKRLSEAWALLVER
ncbi:MAG: ATP-dependent RNA helicase HrpA [Polyangiaceae bacterium]